MTGNQKKHNIEKVSSSERTSTSLDKAPDAAQHRNASADDVAEAEKTLTEVQKQFLKLMDIPVLPVRAIEDICRTSPVPDMMKKNEGML